MYVSSRGLVGDMARVQRPRGTLGDPVRGGWVVERQVKDRADAIAARAGLSTSELISQLINNIELTEQGIPTWMPPVTRDGELPIDPA